MPDKQWKQTHELAWVGGLLEGEGHFGWMSYSPRVDLWMTDEDTILRAATILHIPRIHVRKPGKNRIKPLYGFTSCGKRAIGIMLTTFTFLGQRRRTQVLNVLQRFRQPVNILTRYKWSPLNKERLQMGLPPIDRRGKVRSIYGQKLEGI